MINPTFATKSGGVFYPEFVYAQPHVYSVPVNRLADDRPWTALREQAHSYWDWEWELETSSHTKGAYITWAYRTTQVWASALCIRFTIIPPCLTDPRSFITVLIVTREREQTTLLFWSTACATWSSHSRPTIAASACHFQICFSPLTFWPLVCSPTLSLPSPFYH